MQTRYSIAVELSPTRTFDDSSPRADHKRRLCAHILDASLGPPWLGPVCDDIGAMISDSIKPYRAKNLVNSLRKTGQILRDAGLSANAVPTRLLFPIAGACSIEDNETLQDMWAGLLATASQDTDSVSPSFIETLKQLTPDDARHLETICQESVEHYNDVTGRSKYFVDRFEAVSQIFDGMSLVPWAFGAANAKRPVDFVVPPSVYADTYERLGLIRRTFEVEGSFDRSDVANYYDEVTRHQRVDTEVDSWYEFTEYAVRFLDACHGPLRDANL